MTNLIALTLFIALVLGVVAALQHNHHRVFDRGTVPFGFDAERIADRDSSRVEHDLEAIAAHGPSAPPAAATVAGHRRHAVSSAAAHRG